MPKRPLHVAQISALPSRRPILKRSAVWTAGVVLALAWYVASYPFAVLATWRSPVGEHPKVTAALMIPYLPIRYYVQDYGHPGAESYGRYCNWCLELFGAGE